MGEVEFADSAFRHGHAEDDFFELLAGRYFKIRSHRGLDDIYELLGQNLTGDYLHMVYRVLADGRLRVFHMHRMTHKQRRRYDRMRR